MRRRKHHYFAKWVALFMLAVIIVGYIVLCFLPIPGDDALRIVHLRKAPVVYWDRSS